MKTVYLNTRNVDFYNDVLEALQELKNQNYLSSNQLKMFKDDLIKKSTNQVLFDLHELLGFVDWSICELKIKGNEIKYFCGKSVDCADKELKMYLSSIQHSLDKFLNLDII